jgi:hypothetical protein
MAHSQPRLLKRLFDLVARPPESDDRTLLRFQSGGLVHLVDRRGDYQLVRATDRDYDQYPSVIHILRLPTLTVTPLDAPPWIGVLAAQPARRDFPILDPGLLLAGANPSRGPFEQYLLVLHPVEAFVVPMEGELEVFVASEADSTSLECARPSEWVAEQQWLQLNAAWKIFAD